MRIDSDQGTSPDRPEGLSPEGPPATARPEGDRLSALWLVLLMAGTSWAIASSVSIWLVPPYLALMAWLLFPSGGLPSDDLDGAGQSQSDSLAPAQPGEETDDLDPNPEGTASAGPTDDGAEPATSSSPSRARRGRGRAKKVKPTIEPAEASWVQVAPGKFVRVKASEPTDLAGPHGSPGVPVEVADTPRPSDRDESELVPVSVPVSEPLEDPPTPFDSFERREADPRGAVELGASIAEQEVEDALPPVTFERPPAVDGNAPQAGGACEGIDASGLETPTESLDDRPEPGPSAGWLDEEDERSSVSESFEPIGPPPSADLRPIEVETWGESFEAADPTETPVDETDFDDAGPFDADPRDFDASDDDASSDGPDPRASQGSSKGSSCWPWRLAPRAKTRGGSPQRGTTRPTTPRRPVRSRGPVPSPFNPDRITRIGRRRPRQITRAFPPRSPPKGRPRQCSVVSGR